ncbi:Arginine transport ATP-binding protein ArtM [Pseudovibrio axinellae]|uniref:Arginine transport ATP-binding protein ArtM n=1 Tax=Pseudovibrio axinellae TaxID=989403 RepID=A0A165W0H2_9HYPH|nr:ABC transporter ATP-binding protein [Pseudovibrio axinellae]KZL15761.1 Arginine transport ATP-binding protein ArtM [Pseudovibrio axinellae]SEQ62830.1 amino acid/amide ABC transporter ATP-binding protein 1, HAAT family [Pseudovibrio axinellae]
MRRDEKPVLSTHDLTVRFGGHIAVDAVSCDFHRGTLTAIVGPNGAGKTTFFNLISGQLSASAGTVWFNGEDITRLSVAQRTMRGIGRAFQLTNLFPGLSVRENARLAVQAHQRMGMDLFSMADNHVELIERAEHILSEVHLLEKAGQIVSELSHGDQRKLEVALMIAIGPQVLMFDEPTAGMSVDEVPIILDLISGLKQDQDRTILLVEHKMDVIRSLADRIIVLHNGELVADGAPAEVIASPMVQQAYLGIAPEDTQESAHV